MTLPSLNNIIGPNISIFMIILFIAAIVIAIITLIISNSNKKSITSNNESISKISKISKCDLEPMTIKEFIYPYTLGYDDIYRGWYRAGNCEDQTSYCGWQGQFSPYSYPDIISNPNIIFPDENSEITAIHVTDTGTTDTATWKCFQKRGGKLEVKSSFPKGFNYEFIRSPRIPPKK